MERIDHTCVSPEILIRPETFLAISTNNNFLRLKPISFYLGKLLIFHDSSLLGRSEENHYHGLPFLASGVLYLVYESAYSKNC